MRAAKRPVGGGGPISMNGMAAAPGASGDTRSESPLRCESPSTSSNLRLPAVDGSVPNGAAGGTTGGAGTDAAAAVAGGATGGAGAAAGCCTTVGRGDGGGEVGGTTEAGDSSDGAKVVVGPVEAKVVTHELIVCESVGKPERAEGKSRYRN